MIVKRNPARSGRILSWLAGTAILAMTCSAGIVSAQTGSTSSGVVNANVSESSSATPDSGITQTGCSTCGGGLLSPPSYEGTSGGCSTCGDGGCPSCCHAGRTKCACCEADSCIGKFFCGLHDCICCPDPCYEPRWIPAANSAFFVDAARPVTQMRIRWDAAFGLTSPDRAEYFMPRFGTMPAQVTANGASGGPGKGPRGIARKIDYEDFTVYNEAAVGNFGIFTEFAYREMEALTAVNSATPATSASGFSDMTIGTKTLLLDCELVQFGFEFKTFLPIGNFTKGLGTGHVSLEPSLLATIKLTQDSFIQAQTSYWIPIAGDPNYQANIWHTHLSVNKVLCRPITDVQVIGTLEMNEWSIFGGEYTSANLLIGGAPAGVHSLTSMLSAGPGVRVFICEKIDFGVGTAFSVTGSHWAQELIRSELRLRF